MFTLNHLRSKAWYEMLPVPSHQTISFSSIMTIFKNIFVNVTRTKIKNKKTKTK